MSNIIYDTSIYVRISKENFNKDKNNSIENQQELIKDFLKDKKDIKVISIKIDNGYSGLNFERPAFIEMMEEIKDRKINCIVVKDLSRFGRNYIEVGKYIEQIFPFLGVRFISINDDYDSIKINCQKSNIIIPFKNIINDAYSKDISIKVKSNLSIKMKNGEFIGAFPVYGYKKSDKNKNQLIIDDNVSYVIRDIFKWKLEGLSNEKIAYKLNEQCILSPIEYKKSLGMKYNSGFKTKDISKWSSVTVSRILKNKVYIGDLEQGKRYKPNYRTKKQVYKNEKEWIKINNAHQAIISKIEFETVQNLISMDLRISPEKQSVYLLSGKVKCFLCNQNMVRKIVNSNKKKYVYYICYTYKINKECKCKNIREDKILNIIIKILNIFIIKFYDVININKFSNINVANSKILNLYKNIEIKKSELIKYRNYILEIYNDYLENILNIDEYEKIKELNKLKIKNIIDSIYFLNKEKKNILNNEVFKNININNINRKMIVFFIDSIIVYDINRIELRFNFVNPYLYKK